MSRDSLPCPPEGVTFGRLWTRKFQSVGYVKKNVGTYHVNFVIEGSVNNVLKKVFNVVILNPKDDQI